MTESSGAIEELQQYLSDEGVKAIILRVDSPGGGVGPALQRDLPGDYEAQVNLEEEVVTSMGSVAASGGYYIASASDLIVANPGTIYRLHRCDHAVLQISRSFLRKLGSREWCSKVESIKISDPHSGR